MLGPGRMDLTSDSLSEVSVWLPHEEVVNHAPVPQLSQPKYASREELVISRLQPKAIHEVCQTSGVRLLFRSDIRQPDL